LGLKITHLATLFQCRAFSASQHTKNILTVVSYDEHRKRKRVDRKEYSPPESESAKKKRLRLELKEKRRAFRSYPHTPTGPTLVRENTSEPGSPIPTDLDLSVFSVTRFVDLLKQFLSGCLTNKSYLAKKVSKDKKHKKLIEKCQVIPHMERRMFCYSFVGLGVICIFLKCHFYFYFFVQKSDRCQGEADANPEG
jgi:hypothetical protein